MGAHTAAPDESGSLEAQRWADSILGSEVREPALRVWVDARPTIVLGRAQRADEPLARRTASCAMDVCMRSTGGGAVLAGTWLICTSVILPPGHPLVLPQLQESFRWAGEAHARWLRSLGIPAICRLPDNVSSDPSLDWACFGNLSAWEVSAGEGKIVGLAQARTRNGALLSSAVLVNPSPWTLLCEVMGKQQADAHVIAKRTACCAHFLHGPLSTSLLAPGLRQALTDAIQGAGQTGASLHKDG